MMRLVCLMVWCIKLLFDNVVLLVNLGLFLLRMFLFIWVVIKGILVLFINLCNIFVVSLWFVFVLISSKGEVVCLIMFIVLVMVLYLVIGCWVRLGDSKGWVVVFIVIFFGNLICIVFGCFLWVRWNVLCIMEGILFLLIIWVVNFVIGCIMLIILIIWKWFCLLVLIGFWLVIINMGIVFSCV